MSRSAKPVILVVDDEPDILLFLKFGLESGGFTVKTASTSKAATAVYREHPEIDLVLLAQLLPDLHGPATYQALREINPAVRCCFTSGLIDLKLEADLLGQGVVRVFRKPFHLPTVAEALHQLACPAPDNQSSISAA
jgi:CheY-like chemotaxis protein